MLRSAFAVVVAVVTVAWPREGIVGTYGAYTLARKGYTIAKEINVGEMSDPAREAEVYRRRQQEIEARVRPLAPLVDAWVARVRGERHPYAGWLGAIDWARATERQSDYRMRLPAPRPRQTAPSSALTIETVSLDEGRGLQLYLHMKEGAAPVAEARALVGFVLAEHALGDSPELALPSSAWPGDTRPIAARVEQVIRGDSYSGQASLIAGALVDVRGHQAELARLVDDAGKPAGVRLLAGILGAALRGQAWTAADWARLEAARGKVDRRTLWAWALMLVPEGEQAAREAELQRRAPLSDEDRGGFYREWVKGAAR